MAKKYYIDPSGDGVVTAEDAQRLIDRSEWVKKWSNGSVEVFLSDCEFIGEFDSREDACVEVKKLLECCTMDSII